MKLEEGKNLLSKLLILKEENINGKQKNIRNILEKLYLSYISCVTDVIEEKNLQKSN